MDKDFVSPDTSFHHNDDESDNDSDASLGYVPQKNRSRSARVRSAEVMPPSKRYLSAQKAKPAYLSAQSQEQLDKVRMVERKDA
jgi:hypothetical protein